MLLTQLVRDMDRKIERQRERALKESEPRPVSASEQVELDAIKVPSINQACSLHADAVLHSCRSTQGSWIPESGLVL